MKTTNGYEEHFEESSFWENAKNSVSRFGREALKQSLTLYYCMMDYDTPLTVKAGIASTLGYFLFPLDVIPDLIPGAGYVDDASAIGATFSAFLFFIKPQHKERAEEKLTEWFD